MKSWLYWQLTLVRDSDLCPLFLERLIDWIRYEWLWEGEE